MTTDVSAGRVTCQVARRASGTPASPLEAVWAWQLSARCRDVDPGLFYGSDGERAGARRVRHRRAKEICALCVVIEQCRDHALRYQETFGIWGGTAEDERHAVFGRYARRPVAPNAVINVDHGDR